MVPNQDDGIKVFILPVNEKSFCETYFDILIDNLTKIADDNRCKLINTAAMSCRHECHMSEDLDRGCVSVVVGLIVDPLICKMTQAEFKNKIDEEVTLCKICRFLVYFIKIFRLKSFANSLLIILLFTADIKKLVS